MRLADEYYKKFIEEYIKVQPMGNCADKLLGWYMKTFDTFETVEGMLTCRKLPIIIHAKQINEEFRVNTLEGNYKQGKPGDYLMQGIDNELYICDKEIFEKTYEWVW